MRSRKRAAVGPQSSESASFSASSASSSLRARAPARCRSRSAKCEPRRRLNASRALENRFHSSSSVLRSMPRTVRHSSRIALKRSPACFHCVASAASVSASAASASLRATAATRAASRSARWAPTACSACTTSPSSRAPSPAEVADDVGLGQAVAQGPRASQRVLGVGPARGQPADQQLGLGEHVVEAAREVGETLGRLAGLPGADRPLTVRGADVDRAVGVDAAPPLGVQGRRRHGMPGRGRRRRRDRVRRLGVSVGSCGCVGEGPAATASSSSSLPGSTPGPAWGAGRGRGCSATLGRSAGEGSAGVGAAAGRRGRVFSGRCCRGFRTVLVGAVEPSAVRLPLGSRVLLRHGRLPPPARHDGGRPAAAGPRSAGRRRSMRTVATWDSNSSGPGPKPLRAARRPERWFCRDEPTTPLPSPSVISPAAGPPPLVAVVGPTAAGKSDLGVELAAARWAARSSTPTRCSSTAGWTSARPSCRPPSARGVPHHLLDVLDVTETARVAAYQRAARAAIERHARPRGRTPVLVGGSGLYVQARAWTSWSSPAPTRRCARGWRPSWPRVGPAALHARLAARRPRRRGGGPAQQRAPDRAGAGGRSS